MIHERELVEDTVREELQLRKKQKAKCICSMHKLANKEKVSRFSRRQNASNSEQT